MALLQAAGKQAERGKKEGARGLSCGGEMQCGGQAGEEGRAEGRGREMGRGR